MSDAPPALAHPYENVLVVGATGGIGAALADALRSSGARVHTRSRSTDGLDITDEASVAAAAAGLAEAGPLDGIFVATGALAVDGHDPERAFKHLDPDVMARAFAVNALGPALLVKHLSPLLARDRRVVFAALSARLASIGDNGLGGWMTYRATKAALNQYLHCAAIELSRKRPRALVAALHPGTVPTALSEPYARGRFTSSPEECADRLLAVLDGLSAEDSGGFWDYAGERIPW